MGCPCKDDEGTPCECKATIASLEADVKYATSAHAEVVRHNNELEMRINDLQRAVFVLASEMIR